MIVRSVNIGRPMILMQLGRQVSSAINRKPVDAAVYLMPEGFEGDRVSESGPHGGPDKAACCYPYEHYSAVGEFLARSMIVPSFGENLTTEGLLETEVCVGDRFRLGGSDGGAVIEITQPRTPCFKLAMKHSERSLPAWIKKTGYTGFYVRVIEPGPVETGAAISLVTRPHPDMTIHRVAQYDFGGREDFAWIERLLHVPELSEDWRRQVERRSENDSAA